MDYESAAAAAVKRTDQLLEEAPSTSEISAISETSSSEHPATFATKEKPRKVAFFGSEESSNRKLPPSSKKLPDEEQEGEQHGNAQAGENGFFDPYFGMGATPPDPAYPITMVYFLMDAEHFRKATGASQLAFIFMAKLSGAVLLAVLVIFLFVLFDFQVRVHPKLPLMEVFRMRFSLGSISPIDPQLVIEQQDEGLGNYYAYTLNLCVWAVLNLTNPNKHIDIHYDILDLTVMFSGRALAYDRQENVSHPRGTTIRPYFEMLSLEFPIPLDIGYVLKAPLDSFNDLDPSNDGELNMIIEIIIKAKLERVASLGSMAFWLRWRCLVNFNSLTDDSRCELQEAKWRPDHSGLQFYRQSFWPSDYDRDLS